MPSTPDVLVTYTLATQFEHGIINTEGGKQLTSMPLRYALAHVTFRMVFLRHTSITTFTNKLAPSLSENIITTAVTNTLSPSSSQTHKHHHLHTLLPPRQMEQRRTQRAWICGILQVGAEGSARAFYHDNDESDWHLRYLLRWKIGDDF